MLGSYCANLPRTNSYVLCPSASFVKSEAVERPDARAGVDGHAQARRALRGGKSGKRDGGREARATALRPRKSSGGPHRLVSPRAAPWPPAQARPLGPNNADLTFVRKKWPPRRGGAGSPRSRDARQGGPDPRDARQGGPDRRARRARPGRRLSARVRVRRRLGERAPRHGGRRGTGSGRPAGSGRPRRPRTGSAARASRRGDACDGVETRLVARENYRLVSSLRKLAQVVGAAPGPRPDPRGERAPAREAHGPRACSLWAGFALGRGPGTGPGTGPRPLAPLARRAPEVSAWRIAQARRDRAEAALRVGPALEEARPEVPRLHGRLRAPGLRRVRPLPREREGTGLVDGRRPVRRGGGPRGRDADVGVPRVARARRDRPGPRPSNAVLAVRSWYAGRSDGSAGEGGRRGLPCGVGVERGEVDPAEVAAGMRTQKRTRFQGGCIFWLRSCRQRPRERFSIPHVPKNHEVS